MGTKSQPIDLDFSFVSQIALITERLETVLEDSVVREETSITLSYAQTIDGSIASAEGCTTRISNNETQVLCHQVRSLHQGILVGINTVRVDDPQLNVRLVSGESPRPVILDSRLSIPLTATVINQGTNPLVATTNQAPYDREAQLTGMGIEVLRVDAEDNGQVSLPQLFGKLKELGIYTIMVEGGATVSTELFRNNMFNQVLITVSPRILGGLRSVGDLSDLAPEQRPSLKNVQYHTLAGDLLIYGEKA